MRVSVLWRYLAGSTNLQVPMNRIQSPCRAAFALVLFSALLFNSGCNSDDAPPKKSRDVKFELTGSFSGTLDVTYTTASGGATNESVAALPWTKAITYQSTAQGALITVGGRGGTAGQTLMVKVYAGGTVVSETPGIANSSGIVVVSTPTYIF